MRGRIHIYCGEAKGKTTAAVGLAVRAAGHHIPVLFCQFFKDGSSGEIYILKDLPGVCVKCVNIHYPLYEFMTENEKQMARENYTQLFHSILEQVRKSSSFSLLCLDEVLSAYEYGMIPKEELIEFLVKKPEQLEVVLTGRHPVTELIQLADYITYMEKQKHPYDEGIRAREGIEW